MARSDIRTWLSLDEFAQILGVNPLTFNQLTYPFNNNTICGEIFFSDSWQHSDRVGRNDIAYAIQQAEQDISREVGFNLLPDWTLEERLAYPRPAVAELYGTGVNPRWDLKSVEALRGHLISGGVRTKTLLNAGNAITRADVDSDGYAETCTVQVPITTTDANEVHLYYPAQNGDDGWEIRPIKVSISNLVATITFKAWQIVAANQMDSFAALPLDANSANSYETTVDVYRVWNDPSLQVQFLWEGGDCCGSCIACQLGSQYGCFHLRDARMGFLVPAPGTWNATDLDFDGGDWAVCREPDQIRLWYYSGWRNQQALRPYVDLDPFWKYAIAYYAASKFDRPVCGCSNVKEFIDKWRRDAAFSSDVMGGFTMTSEMAANRLGTTAGAIYAYRAIQKNGVRVNK